MVTLTLTCLVSYPSADLSLGHVDGEELLD